MSLKVWDYVASVKIYLPLSPIDGYTCFTSTIHLSIDAFTGTPAADWKHPPGRSRRTWLQQMEDGVNPLVPLNLQTWTARCGDRYDRQLVKRNSGWVRISATCWTYSAVRSMVHRRRRRRRRILPCYRYGMIYDTIRYDTIRYDRRV